MKFYEFFLNYSCNASCGFCFNPPDAPQAEMSGLSFKFVAQKLVLARAQGFEGLKFIGGEVTLRPDLPKIVRLARKLGYRSVQLTSNGVRLGEPRYASLLARAGVDLFRFSLHGHTARIHDDSVALQGAFAAALRAHGHLKALGLGLGVNTVIHRRNVRHLPAMLDFFYNELGTDDVLLYFVRHQGHMALPGNRRRLELAMADAAPHLRAAYRRLEGQGHERLPSLFHMPPCALPEYARWLLDWSVDDESYRRQNERENLVIHPDGVTERIEAVTHRGKRKIAACRDCRFAKDCLGVESNYLDRYGEAEFNPVPPFRAQVR